MIHDGRDWYSLMRIVIQQDKSMSNQLMDRIHEAMMEDEDTEESRDDFKVLERMWSKIRYRMENRNIPIREIHDWINQTYSRCVIGPVTHDELLNRLAAELDEREKRHPRWRDAIIARHC